MDNDFRQLKDHVGKLDTRVGGLENSVGSLEKAVDKLDTRVGSLEKAVDKLDTRVGSLEKAVAKLDTSMNGLEKAFSRLNTTVLTGFAIVIAVLSLFTMWFIHDSNRNWEIANKALERIDAIQKEMTNKPYPHP